MDSASQELPDDDGVNVSPDAKEFILLLIAMYKDCPELWDSKRKIYMDKNKRTISLNKITNNLKKFDKDFTVEKLKRKINTLRSNFNREHTKIKKSLKSGMSRDEVYQSKLWYYNEMLFITDSTDIAPTDASMQRTAEAAENPPTVSTNSTRKKQKTSENDDLLSLASNYFKRPERDTDIIAKSWAMKLNRLSPMQRRFAEKIINDVLFEGEMESLTRDGVIFISATSNTGTTTNQSMSQSMYTSPSSYTSVPSMESVSSQSLPICSPCSLPTPSPGNNHHISY